MTDVLVETRGLISGSWLGGRYFSALCAQRKLGWDGANKPLEQLVNIIASFWRLWCPPCWGLDFIITTLIYLDFIIKFYPCWLINIWWTDNNTITNTRHSILSFDRVTSSSISICPSKEESMSLTLPQHFHNQKEALMINHEHNIQSSRTKAFLTVTFAIACWAQQCKAPGWSVVTSLSQN